MTRSVLVPHGALHLSELLAEEGGYQGDIHPAWFNDHLVRGSLAIAKADLPAMGPQGATGVLDVDLVSVGLVKGSKERMALTVVLATAALRRSAGVLDGATQRGLDIASITGTGDEKQKDERSPLTSDHHLFNLVFYVGRPQDCCCITEEDIPLG